MPKKRILRTSIDHAATGGWASIALLAMVVAMLGGASRPDEVQLMALRPLVALFLIPAIYFYTPGDFRGLKVPLAGIVLLAAIMALQLIPWPPSVWQSLPGREDVVELSRMMGLTNEWRPISLVPARTLNALLSLLIPVVALLLIAATRVPRTTLLVIVAGIGLFDAAFALTQIISSGNPALYPYRITNLGTAVGLFANQNHSAVFGAVTLMVMAYLLSDPRGVRWRTWQKATMLVAFMIVLLSALIGGSRAGLLATFVAVVSSGCMFSLSLSRGRMARGGMPSIFGVRLGAKALFGFAALGVASVVGLFVLFDRVPALQSLTDASSFDDLRWRILPVLQEMIATFWLLGSGFGSFEEVYHMFEPSSLLGPAYVNQAHNDWAQLLIEGGMPAAILALAGLAWFTRCLIVLGVATRERLRRQLFWLITIAIVIFASGVDYPLRTPLFQFVMVVLIAVFALEASAARDDATEPG